MSTGSGTSDSVYTQNSCQSLQICVESKLDESLWERYRIHQNVLHKQQINGKRSQSFSCQLSTSDEALDETTGVALLAKVHDEHSSQSPLVNQDGTESQQDVPFGVDSDHIQELCRTVSDNDDDASSSDEDISDAVNSSNDVFLKLGNDATSNGRVVKTLRIIQESVCCDRFLKVSLEPITLESSESFFLIDGDSLLCEAMQTKSWKYGQQLHLFYIIELYIIRLQQHVGKCEVVFFDDMEKIWSKDVLIKTFRSALILHLLKNCNLVVHKWGNIFSPEWMDYIRKEQPSFIFVHSSRTCMEIEILFTLIAYVSLTLSLDVAYTEPIRMISSKLNALRVKTERMLIRNLRRFLKHVEYRSVWCYVTECFPKIDHSNFKVTKSIPEKLGGIDAIFFESVHIYWENLTSSEQESYDEKHYICKWAHYFAVISLLTISERLSFISGSKASRNSKALSSPRFSKFMGSIYHCLSKSKAVICISGGCLADLFDISLYIYLFEPGNVVSDVCFKKQVIDKYHHLLSLWKSGDPCSDIFALPSTHFDNISLSASDREGSNFQISLAVTDSRLSEEYAGDVRKTLKVDGNFADIVRDCNGYVFDESYHWHSGKPLCDDIDRFKKEPLSKNPWVRQKQLTDIQKFMNFMTMYGESLGNGIKPLLISSSAFSGRGKKKKAEKKMGKTALSIIEKNKERMNQIELKNASSKWKFLLREIDQIEDLETATKLVIKFINSLDREIVYEEPQFYLLELQFKLWQKSCQDGNRSYTNAAELIHSMHKMIQTEGHVISDKLKKMVAGYFSKVGYGHVAQLLLKDFPGEQIPEEYFIGMPYNIFQMKYMGHLMKRNERSDPDPRVEGFIPDTWQRELLDAIDNYESALVVAPTSSGKTFCSYYCMEKVLREFDDGIVVYVSPTKALVNQVHASIYAKFRKKLPDGQVVVGVFTRDYQHDSMNCQILVTVPQCLEILLLSPKRQNWVSKMRYVILDEVHCIGGEIGGEVWEHLITLIRCPFLALSATIGNPVEFHSWLVAVQEFKYKQEISHTQETKMKFNMVNPKVKLVTYNERYSDIQTSVYVPKTDDLVVTHPCMFLDSQTLRNKGFPSGMNLSPDEAYELWLACMNILDDDDDDDAKESLEAWCPTTHFGNKLFITKSEARQYEICLKQYIYKLIRGSPSKAAMLIRYFRDQLAIEKGALDQKYVDIPGISNLEFDLIKYFPQLIEKLRNARKFPILVFQCDRNQIEIMAERLKRHIDDKVSHRLDKMRHIVQRVEELEALLSVRDEPPCDVDGKYGKIASKIRDVTKHSGSATAMLDSKIFDEYDKVSLYTNDTVPKNMKANDKDKQQVILLKDELNKNRMKIDKVKSECSFISPAAVSAEYLEKVLEKVNDEDIECLIKRGISYHHAGCITKFRKATEILFRCGYIQVVTCTSTLALGIHMPCKTVVIVGDDPYIDALTYRQMIGRSGRRGFDNIGNVVFYGVPVRKISTLVKADLPSLKGLYPISCTLILRLLLLVSNSNDQDCAHKKAMVVLSHPFFTHLRPTYQKQLQHFFLYATDHLIRQLLVDEKGIPLQFAGLVSHLHYLEPGNMLFVYLLRQGIFHDICKPTESSEHCHYGYRCRLCGTSPIIGKMFQREGRRVYLCGNCFNSNSQSKGGKRHIHGQFVRVNPSLKYAYSEETLRRLVCILCHLFCKIEIPNSRLNPRNKSSLKFKKKTTSGSKVLLDPLPSPIFSAIKCYNDDVEVNLSKYVVLVGRSLKRETVVTLPLSCEQWSFFQTDESIHAAVIDNVASPFAQLSGCDNEKVKELCLYQEELFRTLPSEIFMDFNVPTIRLDRKINAYALDFFKHRNLNALDKDNRVHKGSVFHLLKDFMLLIMAIATALKELGPEDGDDHVIWAFMHLAFEYRERFQSCYPKAKIEF